MVKDYTRRESFGLALDFIGKVAAGASAAGVFNLLFPGAAHAEEPLIIPVEKAPLSEILKGDVGEHPAKLFQWVEDDGEREIYFLVDGKRSSYNYNLIPSMNRTIFGDSGVTDRSSRRYGAAYSSDCVALFLNEEQTLTRYKSGAAEAMLSEDVGLVTKVRNDYAGAPGKGLGVVSGLLNRHHSDVMGGIPFEVVLKHELVHLLSYTNNEFREAVLGWADDAMHEEIGDGLTLDSALKSVLQYDGYTVSRCGNDDLYGGGLDAERREFLQRVDEGAAYLLFTPELMVWKAGKCWDVRVSGLIHDNPDVFNEKRRELADALGDALPNELKQY
jgi:hypothetical protein